MWSGVFLFGILLQGIAALSASLVGEFKGGFGVAGFQGFLRLFDDFSDRKSVV